MASNKKDIKHLFEKDAEELPEDEDLRRNFTVDGLMKEHGKFMNNHSAKYTELLAEYINNSKESSIQKRRFKNVFFWVAISMLVLSFMLFVLLCGSLFFKMDNVKITSLTSFISSLIGLLSLYIIIPKIIAKYLFNIKEDKNMTKIVKSIQTYDEKVFANMNTINHETDPKEENNERMILMDLKKNAQENTEESAEENIENTSDSNA